MMLSLSCLCLGFDGCVMLKLIVPFPLCSDLSLISALPPCEVHRGPGCLRQHLLAACGCGGHTAQSLPKQLICIFKQQLPTQQNKMLQPLKSESRMGFVPRYIFGCARTYTGIYQNCVAAITAR